MRFTLLCVLSLLVPSLSHGADEPRASTDEFAASALAPFWKAKQLRESMFFIQSEAGARPQSSLLFKPTKILSVTSATRETTYEAGRDYIVDEKAATLRLPLRRRWRRTSPLRCALRGHAGIHNHDHCERRTGCRETGGGHGA